MAMKLYQSYKVDLDEFNELSCYSCCRKGDQVNIFNYCVECNQYFCTKCLQHHMMTVRKRKNSRMRKSASKYLDYKRYISEMNDAMQKDVFCDIHDLMFCEECSPGDIGSSTNSGYIPEAETRNTKSQERIDVDEALTQVHMQLNNVKQTKQDELNEFVIEKNKFQSEVHDFRKSVIKCLDEFEESTREQLEVLQRGFEEKNDEDINSLEDMIHEIEISLHNLESNDHGKPPLSTCIINGKKNESNANKLLQDMQTSPILNNKSLEPVLNQGKEDFIYNINKLGHIADDHQNTTFLQGQYDMKVKSDRSSCDINGSCHLDDGTLLLTDWNNTKLKRLDNDYKVVDHLEMAGIPWALCPTGSNEVAITLYLVRKIQLVTIGNKMTPTRSFRVGEVCRGVAFSEGKLFVSCGGAGLGEGQGHLRVYSTSGTLLQTFMNDTQFNEPLFSCPNHIAVSDNGMLIHIADRDQGIISLDRNGRKQWVFTDPKLVEAKGICKGGNNDLYVSGSTSDTVIHLDKEGRKLGIILGRKDGIRNPQSLCYDSSNYKLTATNGNSQYIKVFQLVQKKF